MNEQHNPSDPYGVITSAEQLVAGLWQAEQIEEKTKDAPPGSEAVEDEVKTLTAAVNAHLQSRMDADDDVRGSIARFRIFDLDRLIGADVPLWRVGGCDEGPCRNPECTVDHHDPHLYLVTRKADGSYAIIEAEEIFDETEKNHACFMAHGMRQGVIQINLGDIVGKAIEEKVKELSETRDGGDPDPLPPAATVEVVEDEEFLGKLKETVLDRTLTAEPTKPVGPNDDTDVQLPVIDIDEYRLVRYDDEKPGWLRRAWMWLWNWLWR
jgi:hypothetical protein